MIKPTIFINKVLISIILSLSATAIYAEVSSKGIAPERAAGSSAVPVQSLSPATVPDEVSAVPATSWELHAEQWDIARSGETVLSLPALKQLVRAWLSEKNRTIEIQYPGGEDGEFWVQELTDWLVSLGIPSKYMVTTPGSGGDDVIKFNIIK